MEKIAIFMRMEDVSYKPGDKVVSWIEDNKLMIKPSSLVEKELWAIFKKSNLSSDKLIKERKEEAKREEKKS